MRIEPLGDSALLVRVVESFDAEESLDAVLRATRQLELAKIPGVIELAPAYTTIGVFLDSARCPPFDELRTSIRRAVECDSAMAASDATAPTIEVTDCYESEFAPDVNEVARHR